MSNSTSPDERSPNTTTWRFFRPIIVVSAEIASLLVILGSAFSIVIHSILFRKWGLNFLSIVSVNDLILSAIDVVFILFTFYFLFYPVGIFSYSFSKWCSDRIPSIFLFTSYIAIICGWVGIFILFPMTQELNRFAEIFPTSWMYFFIAVGAFIVGAGVQKNISENLGWQSANAFIVLFVFVACSLTALFSFYEGKTDLFVRLEKPIEGCHRPKAVWIGSQSIVARCYLWENESYKIGRYFIVERSEALLLSPGTWDQQFYLDPRISLKPDHSQEN